MKTYLLYPFEHMECSSNRRMAFPLSNRVAKMFISEQTLGFDTTRMRLLGENQNPEARTCPTRFGRKNSGFCRFHCTPASDISSRITQEVRATPRVRPNCGLENKGVTVDAFTSITDDSDRSGCFAVAGQ